MTRREYRPRAATLKRMGVTLWQWLALWEACKGRCPHCLKPMGRSRVPCVDHDHKTGMIRGLICSPCNLWLGYEHDDVERLARIVDYLRHPPALDVVGTIFTPHSIGAAKCDQP